ncbi:MAG: hypothetical protein Q7W51_11325 [Coriobacteriia bacterium]|nr:hypothetical protein [Coriobacteriia bacterium]
MRQHGTRRHVRRAVSADHGRRGVVARTLMVVTLLANLLVLPSPGAAFTTTTIAIDGDFSDWIGVRADPDNVVADTQLPDDPDWPGQPDRDVYLVGTTYDEEYLYFSWRRTAGGTKAITFGAYLDYEGDGLLQDGDKVVVWTVSTGGPYASYANGGAEILHYHQAHNNQGVLYHPEGDPMRDTHRIGVPTGDGETPDGYAGKVHGYDVPLKTMDGYLSPNGDGIECEARVAWSDLGVEPGHPFAVHFAAGNGSSWGVRNKPSVTYKSIGGGRYLEEDRGQVEDNVEPIMYILNRGVTVSPDNSGGGTAGSTVTYTHTITNNGNVTETFDLAALSSLGWSVTITDAGGTPVSSVTLARDASTTVLVNVTIPGGAINGTQDVTTLSATAQSDPGVSDSATDATRVGLVTVSPDQVGTMAPGQTIEYTFTVQNNTGVYGVFDLSRTSTLGWPSTMTDALGNPISTVALNAGESAIVKVQVTVPLSASTGDQDITRLRATMQGNPAATSSATGTTTVADGLSITPENSGFAGANTFVQYTHTITNSWPIERDVTLSYVSSQGWPASFFAADGVTPITQVTVGPYGDTEDIIVRLQVPAGTPINTVDDTIVTATTTTGGTTYTDSATDRTTVRGLSTFADGGFVNQEDTFVLGGTIYAKATGLDPGSNVYFEWRDGAGNLVRTSSTRKVDTQGAAFDEYTSLEGQLPDDDWSVAVYTSGGTLLETVYFTVTFDAEITALSATDAPSVGDEVEITSSAVNHNTSAITDSLMTYLIWWDSNGNGAFGAGDVYIGPSGGPVTWDGLDPIDPTHTTYDIDVAGGGTWTEAAPWTVSNSLFPNQGTYRVTAVWRTQDGIEIDRKTTEFYSIPTLGWPLFGLTIGGAAWALWRRRRGEGGEQQWM